VLQESETEDDVEMLLAAATAHLRAGTLTRTERREVQSRVRELNDRLRAAEERAAAAAAEAARLAPVVAIVEPDERERQLGATEGGRDGAVAELTYADARAELEERCGGDYRKARKAVLKALCKGYGKDPTTGMRMKYSGTASDMWQRLELADAAAGDAPEECASFDVGDAVEVDYGGDLGWVSGKVVTIKDDGTYDVEHSQWDEGSKLQEDVEPGDMRSV
jgi:hypothetical protein